MRQLQHRRQAGRQTFEPDQSDLLWDYQQDSNIHNQALLNWEQIHISSEGQAPLFRIPLWNGHIERWAGPDHVHNFAVVVDAHYLINCCMVAVQQGNFWLPLDHNI